MSTIMIPTETAQAVFDIAVNSLDFGSGFLDTKQVEQLRELAVYLGVDPMLATPLEHRQRYCTGHDWKEKRSWRECYSNWKCEVCGSWVYSWAEMPDPRLGIAAQ